MNYTAADADNRAQLVDEIVAEALDLTMPARQEYLDRACGREGSLRAEVESLVAHAEEPGLLVSTRSIGFRGLDRGEVVDARWKIVEHIAGGGMGDVYEAEDLFQNSRRVALKTIQPEIAADARMIARFKQEVRIGQDVTHRNVCRVFDLGYHHLGSGDSRILYMTMELLRPGRTLSKHIGERGKETVLAPGEALPILRQIAAGLESLHEAGYVHRDVKPQNILLVSQRNGETRAVLTDLGLARRVVAGFSAAPSYTGWSGRSGTPEYMAPEQVTGGELSPATDIYALGVILFQMLTGVLPFTGATRQEIAEKRLHSPAPAPKSLAPDIDPLWNDAILGCLEREPERRVRSCKELVERLESGAKPQPAPVRRSRRYVLVAALAVLMAVLAPLLWRTGAFHESLPAERRVAVLKFANIGGDPAIEAFSDGLMETLTSKLTQLESFQKSLSVIPASDVRKANPASVREAQREFNVNVVITGSIQRSARGFHLILNVVDAKRLKQLRSRDTVVAHADPVAMQQGLVHELAALLDVPLGQEARDTLARGGTSVAGAYEWYIQGRGYLLSGRAGLDRSIEAFERALEKDPRYALAQAGLGEAYWLKYRVTRDRRWIDEAWKYSRQALSIDPTLAPVHTALAAISAGTGDYPAAIAHARQAIRFDPTNYRAYGELAQALDASGNTAGAEAALQEAIAIRKDYWGSYVRLGTFYFRHGRYQDAERAFLAVTNLAPENPAGYTNLGGMYHMQGRTEEAKRALEKSIQLRPTLQAISNLATVYFFEGRYADAAPLFEKLVNEGSKDYRVWGNLADAYRWTPDSAEKARLAYRRAIELTREALAVNRRDTEALSALALYLAKSGDAAAALAAARKAESAAPKDPAVLFDAAIVSEIAGRREDALKYLERALRAGYSKDEIQRDPELKRLRADARYSRLNGSQLAVSKH